MSDLSIFMVLIRFSVRWNCAETGFLRSRSSTRRPVSASCSKSNLASRLRSPLTWLHGERGYGLIKSGVYDMKLTPVGRPPPPWPGDEEYKPALGCWTWNRNLGELRLETNSVIFQRAIASVWDQARFAPEAAEGLQPVVCFVDRVPVPVKAVNKTFFAGR